MTQHATLRDTAPSSRTMAAAVVVEPGRLQLQEVAIPTPGPGQLRIRVEGCGVCASNIPPFEGRAWFKYPLEAGQLGHEAWGTVDESGAEVTGFVRGDRVGFLSNHAYAEYDLAQPNSAVKLPEALAGKPFPAEPLGCAMNILNRSGVRAGDRVAVVGVGFLGALLTRLTSNLGARTIALSRRQFSLDIARNMGAAELVLMDDHWKAIQRVSELTGGRMCDTVIEATGKQWPLDLAAELCRERGRLVIAGYHQDGPRTVNMQLWNWRGLDVINAHEREDRIYLAGMQQALEAVASGALDPMPLFTHRFPLERLDEALQLTRDRPDGFVKALITM